MAHELGPKIAGLNVMSASLVSYPVSDMQVQLFTLCCSVHAFVKHDDKVSLIYPCHKLLFHIWSNAKSRKIWRLVSATTKRARTLGVREHRLEDGVNVIV